MSAKTKIIILIAAMIICLGMIVYGSISEGTPIMDIMPRLVLMGLTAVVVIIRIVSNFFEKQSLDKELLNVTVDTSIMEIKNIEDIWQIEEKENFIAALSQYIAEKCEYGDDIEILNEEQRVLYITQTLEMEVNNGGFSQFFFNSCGMFALVKQLILF